MSLSSQTHSELMPQLALRPPELIMRLERIGSFFPTRLSFLRSLLRKLADEGVGVKRTAIDLDDQGYGHAVYEVSLDGSPYSLIAFSEPLDPENRTDRVIAEAWDACFVLFDGRPMKADIERLHKNAIRQEAGHYDPKVLVLSRANKSVRLFDHVVDRLARGEQPDPAMISKIGYLMRTTAVYGNGKFGMADRAEFIDRPSLSQPFRLEMLTVYLIREFTLDLVNHVAKVQGGAKFKELNSACREQLGIGNSTGLGMAPFLVGHPILINNWMEVRETALARVRAVKWATSDSREIVCRLVNQTKQQLLGWNVDDEPEQRRIETLRQEFDDLSSTILKLVEGSKPWNEIILAAELGSSSLQELMVSLVLEPHGDLIDGLCDCMESTQGPRLEASMTVGALCELLSDHYRWALDLDLSSPTASSLVWYVSEEKLEPRMGDRGSDSEERREMPHHIAHKIQALQTSLEAYEPTISVAEMLMAHPDHRDIVRRVQTIAKHPYGEIQDNLVAQGVRPIDLLRCKLSFFGASKFDPRSDRWTRITLFQGAPTARDLTPDNCGDVFLPAFGTA